MNTESRGRNIIIKPSPEDLQHALLTQLSLVEDENRALRNQVVAIKKSTSWKITAPIRSVMSFMSKGKAQIDHGAPPTAAFKLPEHSPEVAGPVSHPDILAFDGLWQRPARTEEHAYRMLRKLLPRDSSIQYMAFPWATLIDSVHSQSPERHVLLGALAKLRSYIDPERPLATVCQHVHAFELEAIFEELEVSDLYFPHSTISGQNQQIGKANIHPFPLFPVQTPTAAENQDRDLLFSFVGAKSSPGYMTASRDWVIDDLTGSPNSLIIARTAWHYDETVYQRGVRSINQQESDAETYRAALAKSIFTLCPSGTGPNTLRVWEALRSGSIPVILSDDWLPPGRTAQWHAAAIFCEENRGEIRRLPERLARLAQSPETLEAMRYEGQKIIARYGPESFVCDLIEQELSAP